MNTLFNLNQLTQLRPITEDVKRKDPWHYIHAMALDGSVDANGVFHQLTEIDIDKLHHRFQQNVLNALLKHELISQDVVDNMMSWGHSGFNVWSGEPFTDPDTRRFLGRYLKKSPISLERMSIRDDGKIGIARKTDDCEPSVGFDETRLFDPLEFLAELSSHIPNVWEQTTRYFGIYAARTRGAAVKTVPLSHLPQVSAPDENRRLHP